jgi:hypothetical protein
MTLHFKENFVVKSSRVKSDGPFKTIVAETLRMAVA